MFEIGSLPARELKKVYGNIHEQEDLGMRALSERKKQGVIKNIRKKLTAEGFQTGSENPFLEWVSYSGGKDAGPLRDAVGDELFVSALPVPAVAPFDFVTASMRVDFDQIYFEFQLYHIKALAGAVEIDEVGHVYERHATEWYAKRKLRFGDLAEEFSLQWDTAYDAFIRDSLFGNFPVRARKQVVQLIKELRKRVSTWGKCTQCCLN